MVWGTGKRADEFMQWNNAYPVRFFIDSYSDKKRFYGKEIVRPDAIKNWDQLFVVIAVAKNLPIRRILQEKGLVYQKDFCNTQSLMTNYGAVLKKTMFDRSCYDFQCTTMLNHLEILGGGQTSCCCATFLKQQMDSIENNEIYDIWNSILHKILCLSVENHTYTFCKKDMCPFFIGKSPDSRINFLEYPYKVMETTPSVLALGYDSTCNLTCVSCRKQIYVAKGQDEAYVCKISEKIKNSEILRNVRFLIMAGDGEVFASKAYQQVYESSEVSNIKCIRLLSNGTLFTPKRWQHFKQGKQGKILATFSIDAATKETYESIRRGGNFDALRRNMEFASLLRKTGELSYFRMNFVVQSKNYKEMIPFVKWGIELGVDEIFFTKILNWGTYSNDEFKEISMMEADGLTPKAELREILKDPIFKNPIVDLGTIRFHHQEIKEKEIYNYYMWEMERKISDLF